MNYLANLRLAWNSLRSNKMRSFLTVLGVVIGVSAVISVISIGTGAQAQVNSQISSLGTNLLVVRPQAPTVNGVKLAASYATSLTIADGEAIAQQAPAVTAVAPEIDKNFQVIYRNQNANVAVDGTTATYPEVRKAQVASGRFLLPVDSQDAALTCDLGATVASDLFGSANPVGQTVQISQLPFTVVGVMAAKGQAGPSNPDNSIFVPVTTAEFRLMGTSSVSGLSVEAASGTDMSAATSQIERILEQRHGISDPSLDDFVVVSQNNVLQASASVTQTFTVLLGAIAGVSLLVGGIGIMNIMLVSVTERTREIGIRKAIGAPPGTILAQFLAEAVVLSLAGGLVGIGLGIGASRLIGKVAGWATLVPLSAIVLAFGFSAAVGLFFGIYPARRAAHLDPIVALRHE